MAWVQIAVVTLSGNSLGQTDHTHCASVHQAAKLVAALLRAARVTAGLAKSNGSLPPGLWLTSTVGWLQRTGISFGTLRSVIDYGLPLPFTPASQFLPLPPFFCSFPHFLFFSPSFLSLVLFSLPISHFSSPPFSSLVSPLSPLICSWPQRGRVIMTCCRFGSGSALLRCSSFLDFSALCYRICG